MIRRYCVTICLAIFLLGISAQTSCAELFVGTASSDITPDQPVPLCGQFHLRISRAVETPIAASVLVLESRTGEKSLDLAIMVACDVV